MEQIERQNAQKLAIFIYDNAQDTEFRAVDVLRMERAHSQLVAQMLDKTPELGARLPHVGGDE